MSTEKILLTTTVLATADLIQLRFVSFAGAVPAAGQRALGIANAAYAAGEHAGVNTHGELLVEVGAALLAGSEVESDALGRAVSRSTGVAAGVARDTATAAGQIVRVLR
ncbi:capsid cement protein [Serpentinimonas maccroryi]|uniref:capsid cement protein n=1 Tax=Serpentinimonas maccroryi TaxID=1458426 RepID=UPI0020343F50|nr:capsid cement protein [Serpentinimonas maccroryi]MCM2480200.1 DUF2190 family protein [Serpentinimonas maccroryi]